MHAHDQARVQAASSWRRLGGSAAAAILIVSLASGCATPVTPSANVTSSTPSGVSSPPARAVSTEQYADTLRVGPSWLMDDRLASWSSLGSPGLGLGLASVVFSALYRYDAHDNVIPDLADGPCVPLGDGTVIRCRLIATTFQDGTPLTADDVAFSYWLSVAQCGCWGPSLKAVRAVDPRTVDFVLRAIDPSFLTTRLPTTQILPRHEVEAAYASFLAATKDLKAADLTQLADTIDAETNRDPPVCAPRLDAVAALVAQLGVHLYREDFTSNGTFDPCGYMQVANGFIHDAATALTKKGLDAIAAAYDLLATNTRPIGTGPYRFVSEDANGVHLEAWPGYHGGLAATRYLDFVRSAGDGSDVVKGTVDVLPFAFLGSAFQATAAAHGVRIASAPQPGYMAVQINVRPGRLFVDVNLRRALQLCIDQPRDVDAATAGGVTPIYGPVMPGTWAYDPTLPRPARNVAAARNLIAGSGWKLGADGIYTKGGVRLAALIVVRGDDQQRVHMADLIAEQARDCGMDLRSESLSWAEIDPGLLTYPHDIPGTHAPFDLYLGNMSANPDPGFDGLNEFVSSSITDAKNPYLNSSTHNNSDWTGFSDPTVDRLAAAALATYDQATRASLYRKAQQEIAAQVPYVFLWADNNYDPVRAAVATVDGPLDLTAPNWAWQPERLVVAAANP